MLMGQEDTLYTEAEWFQATWRPCDWCGAPVIAHPSEIATFGTAEPRYQLALAQCTRNCRGPATFGGGGHAYRSDD